MPLSTAVVGQSAPPWTGTADARWTMAFAAGIGRDDEAYLDTTREGGVIAHPVFPAAVEWQLLVDATRAFAFGLDDDEMRRGVHASHDLVLHQPVRAGTDVVVTADVAGVERTPPGALLTMRFRGTDAAGTPLWTTWMRSLYRGVAVSGEDAPPVDGPEPPSRVELPATAEERSIDLSAGTAHVYSECARIWNPIHTDRAVAVAAGLEGIILHGTATLAFGVSAALDVLSCRPESVGRLGGSFRAMVSLPSTITVAVSHDGRGRIARFEVRNAEGAPAVRDGWVAVD